MRKIALLAAVTAASVGVVGVAQAVDAQHKLVVKTTPTKAGTKTKPANTKLFVDIITIPAPNDPPFATSDTVVHFDKNLVFNGSKLKQCPQATVQADQTKCPSGSKVGTGKATGNALGQTENLTVTAYNGPGGNKIELHVVGSAPLVIDSVIEGVLKSDTGKFGKKLVVKIPENLQQPLTGVFATLTDFQVTVKATSASKVPFIGLKGCPSNKKLNFKSDLTYTDGTKKSATTTTNCSK
jgi:hypothetical protein